MKDCECVGWKKGMGYLRACMVFASHHGVTYNGEKISFCPWCGKRLKKDKSEKRVPVRAVVKAKSMTKRVVGSRK